MHTVLDKIQEVRHPYNKDAGHVPWYNEGKNGKGGGFMKKAVFLVLISLVGMQAFPQVLQHLSMGYNSFYDSSLGNTTYYFYGYEGYSEGIIWHNGNVALSTREPGHYEPGSFGRGYPLSVSYKEYQGRNNSIGYSAFMSAVADQGLEYRLTVTDWFIGLERVISNPFQQ